MELEIGFDRLVDIAESPAKLFRANRGDRKVAVAAISRVSCHDRFSNHRPLPIAVISFSNINGWIGLWIQPIDATLYR